jgi:hypothetical protein
MQHCLRIFVGIWAVASVVLVTSLGNAGESASQFPV